jgi:hypothetical protein
MGHPREINARSEERSHRTKRGLKDTARNQKRGLKDTARNQSGAEGRPARDQSWRAIEHSPERPVDYFL